MDSYVGLRHAPLPAPAAIAMHINQRGTSSPSPLEREIEEGGMKQTFSKRPGLHISWHITNVLPQLRRQLIKIFMKGGVKREGEGRSRKAFLIYIHIDQSFRLSAQV